MWVDAADNRSKVITTGYGRFALLGKTSQDPTQLDRCNHYDVNTCHEAVSINTQGDKDETD
jgi:hypothetical protein